jgi:hypothetical protein
MLKGGHYEHNLLFKQCFVVAVNTPRVTVLRNVFQARQAYSKVLYKDTSHVVVDSRSEGTCTTVGELAPTVSHFFSFFVLQGGVQELRMDQPCGPLLYVPGKFFWYCYKR